MMRDLLRIEAETTNLLACGSVVRNINCVGENKLCLTFGRVLLNVDNRRPNQKLTVPRLNSDDGTFFNS